VIGLFGIGEILLTMEEGLAFKGKSARASTRGWSGRPGRSCRATGPPSLRSTLIGCWMGITPGGATPASFMSYGMAKKFAQGKPKFGTGELEGVVAPETAAHAAGTSALLPMLDLGIPGSPTAAVLLGGLLIWGLQPGPLLFVEQKDFVWGLIASMYLGNIVGLIVVLTTVPLVGGDPAHPVRDHRAGDHRHLRDRRLHGAQRDVRRGADAAVRRAGLPVQEARLPAGAAGAGPGAGRHGRQGEVSIMWSNPLVGSITTLALVMLLWPLISKLLALIRAPRQDPLAAQRPID
jgi:putative tricarboxylic transport membrane protein